MARIYTRAGDTGETALYGGGRVRKDDPRMEAIGTVDELNAIVGVVRTELARGGTSPPQLDAELGAVQHQLFDVGAELATLEPTSRGTNSIGGDDVTALERQIDRYDLALEPLRAFILPGGSPAAAQLHAARCVCRRAERRIVQLSAHGPIREELVRYLNRLSDLLFVLARAANQANHVADVQWAPKESARKALNRQKPIQTTGCSNQGVKS